jgi:hypothetical protein
MTPEHETEQESTPTAEAGAYETPAIIALGKLDEVTFGAPGPPFEGATSYF